MILQLTSEHDVAVLEMGMSDLGEIRILQRLQSRIWLL